MEQRSIITFNEPPIHSTYDQVSSRPDWIMVGAPSWTGEGVMILASRSLSRAQLEYAVDTEDFEFGLSFERRMHVVGRHLTITAMIDHWTHEEAFIIIQASDYGKAIRHLLKKWSPDGNRPPMDMERDDDTEGADRPEPPVQELPPHAG
jgi:hypothetical protein